MDVHDVVVDDQIHPSAVVVEHDLEAAADGSQVSAVLAPIDPEPGSALRPREHHVTRITIVDRDLQAHGHGLHAPSEASGSSTADRFSYRGLASAAAASSRRACSSSSGWPRRTSAWSSRNAVCVSPARKAGCASTRSRNAVLVIVPSKT